MYDVHYVTYDENVDKKVVFAELNEDGLYKPNKWINHICDSYEQAEKYIEENDDGSYCILAVKYRSTIKPNTKTYEKLRIKQKELCDKINSVEREFYNKSKFITCKECGSKLATSHLHSSCCPLCHKDLRPATILNKIEKLKAKLENVRKKISEMEIKSSKKAPIKWLVKNKYHI